VITATRARRVARQDANAAAKIIAIQEKQIEELRRPRLGCDHCRNRATVDLVDTATGEISVVLCPECGPVTEAAVDAYLRVTAWGLPEAESGK
jgi:hypothetical protein